MFCGLPQAVAETSIVSDTEQAAILWKMPFLFSLFMKMNLLILYISLVSSDRARELILFHGKPLGRDGHLRKTFLLINDMLSPI